MYSFWLFSEPSINSSEVIYNIYVQYLALCLCAYVPVMCLRMQLYKWLTLLKMKWISLLGSHGSDGLCGHTVDFDI